MRIARVREGEEGEWAVVADGSAAYVPATTIEELDRWIREGGPTAGDVPAHALGGTRPPFDPVTVIGVGLNYTNHAAEVGVPVPPNPLLFSTPAGCVVGPGAAIRVDPRVTVFADWEVELAVIVGRRMQRVAVDDALEYVLGYTVANDVTARDIQEADVQWFRSKSIDTFCPLGPWIVTPDEVGDPQSLMLETRLNGEVVQHSGTDEMSSRSPSSCRSARTISSCTRAT
jgi:2-keto-4-pentenoate hydratase/2-oxohepta-3-ene-1,7-dioic acid hydratase in catechol pathway